MTMTEQDAKTVLGALSEMYREKYLLDEEIDLIHRLLDWFPSLEEQFGFLRKCSMGNDV